MNIGDKEIVFNTTFILPDQEILEFEFSPTHPGPLKGVAHNWVLIKVKVKVGESENQIAAQWGLEAGQNYVTITLPKDKNVLITGMEKPMRYGEVAGKNLGFHLVYASAGNCRVITIQFLYGGAYE